MSQKQILLESLKGKGFSKEIIDAFSKVKREDFIPKDMKKLAYEDTSLPIGQGQTISQPYTIAMMFSLLELKKGQKVLEVGSGCGYALSLLSEIVGNEGKIFGMEIIKELFEKSKKNLKEYKNVRVYNQNGIYGLREESSALSQNQGKVMRSKLKGGVNVKEPCSLKGGVSVRGTLVPLRFDRILISAAYTEIPKLLVEQLKDNGIIVAPLGKRYEQSLIAYKKAGGHPLCKTPKKK